jgi:transposase InsO family protein
MSGGKRGCPESSWACGALCICSAGDRFTTADPLQCDRTSDGGMDIATATGSATRRSGIQVPASRPPQDLLWWFGRGSCELGIEVLKSPAHAPTANAFCERLIGTIRRECLDYVIPLSESHLKGTVREWVNHYNCGPYYPTSLCA